MEGMLLEPDWETLGLTLLSSDYDRNIILFSSQGDLTAFLQRLDAYDGPIPDGQQGRRYEGFVTRIENVGTLESPGPPRYADQGGWAHGGNGPSE